MATIDVLAHIREELQGGRLVAFCAIVATRGSTPQPVGAAACVDQSGSMIGTLGGGCAEAEVKRTAFELLCDSVQQHDVDRTRDQSHSTGLLHTVEFDHDFGHDDGMICGGTIDVATCVLTPSRDGETYRRMLDGYRAGEAVTALLRVRGVQVPAADSDVENGGGPCEYRVHFEAAPNLLIAGAGHIGRIVAQFAVSLGFRVTVIDERSDFVGADRFPSPIIRVAADIAAQLAKTPIDANTYIVIVTRGHKHDEKALAAVLNSSAKFIGMIGSRRKITVVFDDLRHAGFEDSQLARVRAPIGLDIGAVTTEEIALSITAELVSIRRSTKQPAVEGPIQIAEKT